MLTMSGFYLQVRIIICLKNNMKFLLQTENFYICFHIAAVATHKYVMSFWVGLELYMAKTRLSIYVIYIFVWSIMSPVGIGIGLAVLGNIAHPINYYMSIAILQALAAGTILYVVAFEILERERSKSISGLVQLCFVIVGFAAMMTVEILGIYMTYL